MPDSTTPELDKLTPLAREFVLAFLEQRGHESGADKGYLAAFRKARQRLEMDMLGYESMRSGASMLARRADVKYAIVAEARHRFGEGLPIGIHAIKEIAETPEHKDRLAAAKMLVGPAGISEVIEHRHTHTLALAEDPEKLQRFHLLAQKLGVPVERLIGKRLASLPAPNAHPVIDAEYQEAPTDWREGLEDVL